MYYAHFGLIEPPFKITPNTEFFFTGANRGAVLDALKYAISSGEGIIKVVGEVGSGKTMLCRMLQNDLPEKIESIYLANPSVAPEDILHALAFELQLKITKDADRLKVMQVLQDHLLKRHTEGKQVVIFVEEAQGMPIETLEEIRLLSNLETKQDKLLQIVLFGQPELDENLNQNKIRQLRERITHSFYLTPFDKKDIGSYIEFRLRKAGYTGPPIFTPYALRLLSQASQGLVRRANILADKALLATFSENMYQVTHKHVIAAIRDSEFGREKNKLLGVQHWLYPLLALLVFTAFIAMAYLKFSQYTHSEKSSSPNEVKANIANSASALPSTAVTPNQAPISPTAEAGQPAVTKPEAAANAETLTPAATPASALNKENAPLNKPLNKVDEPLPQTIAESPEPLDNALNTRFSATETWLTEQPSTTTTIQLMGVANDSQLREQLKHLKSAIEVEKIYIYRTQVNGNPFITLTYGSYSSKSDALQAMAQLPDAVKAYQPHIRTIGGINKEIKPLQ